jgi:transposase
VTTIGIDLGDRFSSYCAIDGHGSIVAEGRVPTTAAGLQLAFGRLELKTIAIEAGTHSPWVSRLFEGMGHRVIVANARKLRLIYENTSKDDRVDARYLARVARLDPELLAGIEHRGCEAQRDLAVIRSREALVSTRTRLVSHARGVVKSFGARLPACSAESFDKKATAAVPAELRAALTPIMDVIATVTKQIKRFDQQIERMVEERYPPARHLMRVCCVGALTALTFMLTIEDPRRFVRSRSVGAWVGLVPARYESGQSRPQQGITKCGDAYLRRLLVSSAHHILGALGKDSDLRRHGEAIAARGGKNAKKRAVVAVARKLAVLLHRLWVTGEIYEPLRNTNARLAA